MGDLFDRYFPHFIVGLFLLVVAGIGYAIYDELTAETFSLRVDSWRCERSHTETTWIQTGKTGFVSSSTVCDRWDRR